MSADETRPYRWLAALGLSCLGVVQLTYGLLGAPLLAMTCGLDPALVDVLQAARAGFAGFLFTAFGLVLAFMVGLGVVGVLSGRSWGWFLGVTSAVLWLPTACAPLSLAVLALLLHPRVRTAIVSDG